MKGKGVVATATELGMSWNKTEEAYAGYLDLMVRADKYRSWAFEAVKLRLAKSTFYTPDFMVVTQDGEIEMHEVKGFWRDDARVKIKVASEMFPFRFIAVQLKRGDWVKEVFE